MHGTAFTRTERTDKKPLPTALDMLIPVSTFNAISVGRGMLAAEEWDGVAVAAIAQHVGLSTGHFIRMFKRAFGSTPHQYRTACRMRRARHSLALTRNSVTEVCLDVGYVSPSTFSTTFQRIVGESPQRFTQRWRSMGLAKASALLQPGCFDLMGSAISEKSSD